LTCHVENVENPRRVNLTLFDRVCEHGGCMASPEGQIHGGQCCALERKKMPILNLQYNFWTFTYAKSEKTDLD